MMIDPNEGISSSVLRMMCEASFEQYKANLMIAIEQLLYDFQMTWDDLAEKLREQGREWANGMEGTDVKQVVAGAHHTGGMDDEKLNDIGMVFSTVPYVIFRPREPWVPKG